MIYWLRRRRETPSLVYVQGAFYVNNLDEHVSFFHSVEECAIVIEERDWLGLCGADVLLLPCHVACWDLVVLQVIPSDILGVGQRESSEVSCSTRLYSG